MDGGRRGGGDAAGTDEQGGLRLRAASPPGAPPSPATGSAMLTIIAVVAGVLAATGVHELGHLLAAGARRVRVTRFIIGRGPRLTAFRRGGVEYVLAALPVGGRVDYERPASGTANAVIAIGGPAANVAFGFALLWGAALALGVERMPFAAPGTSPLAYAAAGTATWLRVLPAGVLDLVLHADPASFAEATATLRRLLLAREAGLAIHAVAALSIAWAVLNMIPVPGLGTDGWHFLVSLREAVRRIGARASG